MGRRRIDIDKHELKRLADDGMTIEQLAEHFGCSIRVISRRRKEYGIQYGRGHAPANIKANNSESRTRQLNKARKGNGTPLEVREANFVARLAADPRTQMYEYVRGYSSELEKLTVRCRGCGEEKQTTPQQLFSKKYDHHVCFNCQRIARNRAEHERKAEIARREAEEYAKERVCPTCGSVFHSPHEGHVYCSPRCKRAGKNSRRDTTHRGRARKYGVDYDPSITWQSLSNELGHCNCQICGKPCDPEDTSWNGAFGPLYPTVDCIVPMSRGGGYVLGNVQLAHAICNSVKRDLEDGDDIYKAVAEHATDVERDEGRHEAATAEDARARARGVDRPRRRIAQHGAAGAAVPRDYTRDCRVGGGVR